MDNNQQRLIPIKKADGTIERITFDEFKRRQQTKATVVKKDNTLPPVKPSVAISSTVSNSTPVNRMGTPAPVAKAVVPPQVPAKVPLILKPAPMITVPGSTIKKSETSLLEEPLDMPVSGTPVLADDRMVEVEKIVKRLRFIIREPERLKKVIQARLKDIRSESDTEEKLVAPIEKGGVGLSASEAREVLNACAGNFGEETKPKISETIKSASMPVRPPVRPSSPMDIFVEQRSMSGQIDDISSLVKKSNNQNSKPFSESAPMHPVVRDVISVKKSGYGPVDEIQSYTLVDFRRLSAKPVEAAARLKQKFIILRDESYLFYIKSLVAWRQSPLYLTMTDKVAEALNKKLKLTDVLTPDGIKMEEIDVLLAMEKDLN